MRTSHRFAPRTFAVSSAQPAMSFIDSPSPPAQHITRLQKLSCATDNYRLPKLFPFFLLPFCRSLPVSYSLMSPRLDRALIAVMLAGVCTFLNVYCTQPLLPYLSKIFH